jgi:hypothetical protein
MKHKGNPFQKPHAPLGESKDGAFGERSLGDLMQTILRTGEIIDRSNPQPEIVPQKSTPAVAPMDTAGLLQDIRRRIDSDRQAPLPEIPRQSDDIAPAGPMSPAFYTNKDTTRVPVSVPKTPETAPVIPNQNAPETSPAKEVFEAALELAKKGKSIAASVVHRARQQFKQGAQKTAEALEENFPELQSPGMMVMREAVATIAADTNENLKKTLVSVGGKELSRRSFLGGALATAAVGQGLASSLYKAPEAPKNAQNIMPGFDLEPATQEQGIARELGPRVYDMGKLAGKGAGGLTALYLNMKPGSVIEKQETIDFTMSVGDIWDAKVGVVQKKKPGWVDNTRRAKVVFEKIYETQQHKNEFLSLEQLTNRMDVGVRDVNQSLDWKNLNTLDFNEVNFTNLTESDVELVKKLSEKIDGTMLMAYVMTEIMPALKDHSLNMELLDFLSQNAGVLYLIVLAAMGDPYISNGPFQFTSFAVYDVSDKDKRGASAVNMLLPKGKRIGGSVISLKTIDDHIKAGQLFAVYNIAAFLSGLRRNQKSTKADQLIGTLWNHLDTLDDDVILKYISAAHHLPGNARKALGRLVDNGFQKDFLDFADKGIKTYAKKSAGGHSALKKRLGR